MATKHVGVGIGISLGLCYAAAFGTAMQNLALGVAFGVSIAVAFGLAFSADSGTALARKNVTADKPLQHPLGLLEGITNRTDALPSALAGNP
jgi:MFS superfamily sulfate permease-like transporter